MKVLKYRFKPFKRRAANTILCWRCDKPTRVFDSRVTLDNEIWRRRICENGHRVTTVERWMEPHGTVTKSRHGKLIRQDKKENK